ncbi:hypothetical protein MASR1M97_23270 [Candidatus Desulfobacillus denitrificans]
MLHDGSEPGIPRVHIALHRSHAQPRFNAADKALLAALLPHLREATHLGFRLAEMEQALRIARSTADAILPALVMTDAAGHVASSTARQPRSGCSGERLNAWVPGIAVVGDSARQELRIGVHHLTRHLATVPACCTTAAAGHPARTSPSTAAMPSIPATSCPQRGTPRIGVLPRIPRAAWTSAARAPACTDGSEPSIPARIALIREPCPARFNAADKALLAASWPCSPPS